MNATTILGNNGYTNLSGSKWGMGNSRVLLLANEWVFDDDVMSVCNDTVRGDYSVAGLRELNTLTMAKWSADDEREARADIARKER